jgi:SagB-type dehydrogenase family enzyme
MLTAVGAQSEIKLPQPSFKGTMSVEAAIVGRRSERSFQAAPLTLNQVSQLLWAAGGLVPDAIAGATRKVTPSAGGLYPIDTYLISGERTVEGLPAGVYQYDPSGNSLKTVVAGEKRGDVARFAYSQGFLARAPAIVLIAGVFQRSSMKYGNMGVNYTLIEAGNCDQNLCLQATATGLRSATVGAFSDAQKLATALKLPANTVPLLVVAVGK